MKEVYTSRSPAETEALAEALAKRLPKTGCVLAMTGELGMGKTVFVRGLARGLGLPPEAVQSPTFAIVHDYGGDPQLVHFDMYRVATWDDLYTTGFFDYLDAGAVLAVEWSENIAEALPENTWRIHFVRAGDTVRTITIEGEDL